MLRTSTSSRTVVILGGSYAGLHAIEVLAQRLPSHWSLILIERNSHFNHIYSFPRNGVLKGHAQKSFIPYSSILNQDSNKSNDLQTLSTALEELSVSSTPPLILNQSQHRIIQANVTKIDKGVVQLDRLVDAPVSTARSYLSPHPSFSGVSRPASVVSDDSGDTTSIFDSGYASSSGELRHKLSRSSFQPGRSLGLARSKDSFVEDRLPPVPQTSSIHWDFLVYALGSHLPPPLRLPGSVERTKSLGVSFLQAQQDRIAKADRIVVVGGGPLGIQYATDIAHRYKLLGKIKSVTLVHSRTNFLPTFLPAVDEKIKSALLDFGVKTVMGERVNLVKLRKDIELQASQGGVVCVESLSNPGLEWKADLVIPNTGLMAEFCPLAVPGGARADGTSGMIRVNRALQVDPSSLGPSPVERSMGQQIRCECADARLSGSSSTPVMGGTRLVTHQCEEADDPIWSRVFAVGDCIDGFGAIKAGHTGWNQAEVAARNILKLVDTLESGGKVEEVQIGDCGLERYEKSEPMIKLTLGLNRVVCQLPSPDPPHSLEVFEKRNEIEDDVSWRMMWTKMGIKTEDVLDGWA